MAKRDYILFKYRPNKTQVAGFFDEDDGNIYINADLGRITRKFVYTHEAQHQACFLAGCKCYKKLFWCEYHAFGAEFKYALKMDKRKYWRIFFRDVISALKKFQDFSVGGWKEHFMALRKVCRLKEFVVYARKYGYYNQIEELL